LASTDKLNSQIDYDPEPDTPRLVSRVLRVGLARAMSSRISTCADNGSEAAVTKSYQSDATSSAAKSSKGPTHDTEFYD
jgi:hypothetical protein